VLCCLQVAFDFSIDLSRLSRQGVVEASPVSGKVAAGEKARIKLRVSAALPSERQICAAPAPAFPDVVQHSAFRSA
jgi:hypothetical protein